MDLFNLHMRLNNVELELRKREAQFTGYVRNIGYDFIQLPDIANGGRARQVVQFIGIGNMINQLLERSVFVLLVIKLCLHKKLHIRIIKNEFVPGFLRRCVDDFPITQTYKSFHFKRKIQHRATENTEKKKQQLCVLCGSVLKIFFMHLRQH